MDGFINCSHSSSKGPCPVLPKSSSDWRAAFILLQLWLLLVWCWVTSPYLVCCAQLLRLQDFVEGEK